MTAASSDGDAEATTPQERAMNAMSEAVAQLEKAHANAENAAMAGAAEQEHVSAFVEAVAEELANGLNEAVGLYAGAVAEETEYYSKTDLKQQIKDKSEEYRGGDKKPLDQYVQDRLESVTVVKTTDHRQGAEYIWDFETFLVETRAGKDRRGHFRFDQFRDLIHESGGVNLAKPVKDRRSGEGWRDFMADMLDRRGREEYARGPRTKAVEALGNKLKRQTGYGTPEAALDHTGVWVVRETLDVPEWWANLSLSDPSENRDLPDDLVTEVRVHESVIEPVLENAEITRTAFYNELNARNYTVPGTSGASITEWVDGSNERFWALRPDVGTPRSYVADPNAGIPTRPPLFGGDAQEQRDEQPEEHAEPVEAGGSDAPDDDSDGFDSVGDTA